MHQWCPLYRDSTVAVWKTHWVQPKILVLVINFFALNFTSIEIVGQRMSSSQNERSLGVGGRLGEESPQKRTRVNKLEVRVKTGESWANVLFECPHMLSRTNKDKCLYAGPILNLFFGRGKGRGGRNSHTQIGGFFKIYNKYHFYWKFIQFLHYFLVLLFFEYFMPFSENVIML